MQPRFQILNSKFLWNHLTRNIGSLLLYIHTQSHTDKHTIFGYKPFQNHFKNGKSAIQSRESRKLAFG